MMRVDGGACNGGFDHMSALSVIFLECAVFSREIRRFRCERENIVNAYIQIFIIPSE